MPVSKKVSRTKKPSKNQIAQAVAHLPGSDSDARAFMDDARDRIEEATARFCFIESALGPKLREDDLAEWAAQDVRDALGHAHHLIVTALAQLARLDAEAQEALL